MNYDTERNTENDCTELVAEQGVLPCLCGQFGLSSLSLWPVWPWDWPVPTC